MPLSMLRHWHQIKYQCHREDIGNKRSISFMASTLVTTPVLVPRLRYWQRHQFSVAMKILATAMKTTLAPTLAKTLAVTLTMMLWVTPATALATVLATTLVATLAVTLAAH